MKTKDPSKKEALRLWLNTSSAADIEIQRKFLEACKWEVISDLDEFQYQIKKGRLEDLGFVDYFEAIGLYARGETEKLKNTLLQNPLKNKIEVQKSKIQESEDLEIDSELLPDVIVGMGPHTQSFFAQTILTFKEGTQEKLFLSRELARTLNAGLSADKLLPKTLTHIQQGIERSHSYLSLGLLILSKGDPTTARSIVLTQKFSDIFRLGWLSVQDLVSAAQNILKTYGLLIFDSADREFLKSLRGRHPEISQEVLSNLELGFNSTLKNFDIKTLLKLGAFVQTLNQFALWLLSAPLRKLIGIPEFPFLTQENSIVRLNNFILRKATKIKADSFEGEPFSEKEWKLASTNFKTENLVEAQKDFINTLPELLKPFVQKRLLTKSKELSDYISSFDANKSGLPLPDSRYFSAISFR